MLIMNEYGTTPESSSDVQYGTVVQCLEYIIIIVEIKNQITMATTQISY